MKKYHILWLFALCVLLESSSAIAQQSVGTIKGTVQDPCGGVIVGATVVAHHDTMGVESTAVTNREGLYVFPVLNIGTHTLTASYPGFRAIERKEVRVISGVALTLDFELPVGDVHQTTTVTSESPTVDTVSSKTSTSRVRDEISELPINVSGSRSSNAFLATVAGVNPGSGKTTAFINGAANGYTVTTFPTRLSVMRDRGPGRGSSGDPSGRRTTKRAHQLRTVCRFSPGSAPTCTFVLLSA